MELSLRMISIIRMKNWDVALVDERQDIHCDRKALLGQLKTLLMLDASASHNSRNETFSNGIRHFYSPVNSKTARRASRLGGERAGGSTRAAYGLASGSQRGELHISLFF